MNVFERYIENYCKKFNESTIAYCIDSGDFYYEMHTKYNHEMLITFPINSSQILEFLSGLNQIFHENDNVYWHENYGEESGANVDRIWIWW